jgi:hypothetical protein
VSIKVKKSVLVAIIQESQGSTVVNTNMMTNAKNKYTASIIMILKTGGSRRPVTI